MTTQQRSTPVRVRINPDPRVFGKGLKSAHRLHGKYDSATKTWLIPAAMAEFLGPQNPGLIVVSEVPTSTPVRCPHYTPDQGCPLHGELCAAREVR